jgi:hypothetical protein
MHARQQRSENVSAQRPNTNVKYAIYNQQSTATAIATLVFDPTPFLTFCAPNDGTCTHGRDVLAGALGVHAVSAKASPNNVWLHSP